MIIGNNIIVTMAANIANMAKNHPTLLLLIFIMLCIFFNLVIELIFSDEYFL